MHVKITAATIYSYKFSQLISVLSFKFNNVLLIDKSFNSFILVAI